MATDNQRTEGDELDRVFAQAEALVRNRCEIQDLYFWLGEEAERVGFTPWGTFYLAKPREPSANPVVRIVSGPNDGEGIFP